MATNSHLHYFLSFFLPTIFLILTLHCSLSSSLSPIASDQLKFWSENVQNQMPDAILQKLSPLTKKQSDYYTTILATTNGKFTADANFCSLAKLACKSVFHDSKPTSTKTYKPPAAINSLITTKTYSTPKSTKTYDTPSAINTHTTTKTYDTPAATNLLSTKNTYTTEKTYNAAAKHSHENEDPFSFFRQSVLKQGNLVHLPNLQESLPNRAFLPAQLVSQIPLSCETIAKIFPDMSTQTMQATLSSCNAAAIQGETKSCPKSLEEMVGFASSALGANKVLALTSKIRREVSSSALLVRKMKLYSASKIVACHEAFLPFAAYYCHSLPSTRLYEVEFVDPKDDVSGVVNRMLAICHLDTSAWPKEHVAFEILNFGPGEGEACHWFSKLDLAWISAQE